MDTVTKAINNGWITHRPDLGKGLYEYGDTANSAHFRWCSKRKHFFTIDPRS